MLSKSVVFTFIVLIAQMAPQNCQAQSDLDQLGLASPDHCQQRQSAQDALTRIGAGKIPDYEQILSLYENALPLTSEDPWLMRDAEGKAVYWRLQAMISSTETYGQDAKNPIEAKTLQSSSACGNEDLALILNFSNQLESTKVERLTFSEADGFTTHRVSAPTYVDMFEQEAVKFELPIYEGKTKGQKFVQLSFEKKYKLNENLHAVFGCKRLKDNQVNFLICSEHGLGAGRDFYIFSDGHSVKVSTKIIYSP